MEVYFRNMQDHEKEEYRKEVQDTFISKVHIVRGRRFEFASKRSLQKAFPELGWLLRKCWENWVHATGMSWSL